MIIKNKSLLKWLNYTWITEQNQKLNEAVEFAEWVNKKFKIINVEWIKIFIRKVCTWNIIMSKTI